MNVFLSGFGWWRGIGLVTDTSIIVLHTLKSGILVSLQDSFVELDLVMIVEIWRTSTVVHLNVGCDGARLVIVL